MKKLNILFLGLSYFFFVIVLCQSVVVFGGEEQATSLINTRLPDVEGAPLMPELLLSASGKSTWSGHGQGGALLEKSLHLIATRAVIQASGTTYEFQLLNKDEVCIRRGKIKVPEFDLPFCVLILAERENESLTSQSSNTLWAIGMKVPLERTAEIVSDAEGRLHYGIPKYLAPSERMHIMPIVWDAVTSEEESLSDRLHHDLRRFRFVWGEPLVGE